jgi:hypothetical protein
MPYLSIINGIFTKKKDQVLHSDFRYEGEKIGRYHLTHIEVYY